MNHPLYIKLYALLKVLYLVFRYGIKETEQKLNTELKDLKQSVADKQVKLDELKRINKYFKEALNG